MLNTENTLTTFGQTVHSDAPVSATVPLGQISQLSFPEVAWNIPAGHVSHLVLPTSLVPWGWQHYLVWWIKYLNFTVILVPFEWFIAKSLICYKYQGSFGSFIFQLHPWVIDYGAVYLINILKFLGLYSSKSMLWELNRSSCFLFINVPYSK